MTDQPKWTPGPWQINGSHFYGPDPDRFLIGHMNGGGPFDANLNLIAAAPDMATVLEYYADQFCEGFCKDLPQAGTYQPEMDLDCSGCKARAALAKARGETK